MNADTTSNDARLVALESKLTLAEDLLDELNRTVFRQQERLDALTRELVEMRRQQLAMDDPRQGLAANERPPHY